MVTGVIKSLTVARIKENAVLSLSELLREIVVAAAGVLNIFILKTTPKNYIVTDYCSLFVDLSAAQVEMIGGAMG